MLDRLTVFHVVASLEYLMVDLKVRLLVELLAE